MLEPYAREYSLDGTTLFIEGAESRPALSEVERESRRHVGDAIRTARSLDSLRSLGVTPLLLRKRNPGDARAWTVG